MVCCVARAPSPAKSQTHVGADAFVRRPAEGRPQFSRERKKPRREAEAAAAPKRGFDFENYGIAKAMP